MGTSAQSSGTAEAALVAAWDEAAAQPAWRRALVLLAALDDGGADGVRGTGGAPARPPDVDALPVDALPVDALPVGAVAVRLLALAQRWSIRRIDTIATCRACAERLDVTLGIDDLLAGAPASEPAPAPFPVQVGDAELLVRLPTPADLAAVARCPDPAAAELELLRRCVPGGWPAATAPRSIVDAVSAVMAERDPYGVITVDVACPGCGIPARCVLDVPEWWWGIADVWVRRLLGEVHRLARAYGWTEPEVLALGPRRRAAYLELVP